VGIDYLLGFIMFALWIADLFFPVWLFKGYRFGRQKGWSRSLSWLFASSMVYILVFTVANLVGWNVGAYALMIPTYILIDYIKSMIVIDTMEIWILYSLSFAWFVLLPTVVLYIGENKKERDCL